jgi:hypothetical protein
VVAGCHPCEQKLKHCIKRTHVKASNAQGLLTLFAGLPKSIKTQTCLIFCFHVRHWLIVHFHRHIKTCDWSLLVIGEYALHPCGESEILTCHLVSKARGNQIFLACLGENYWNRRVCSSPLWWIRNLDFQNLIHSLCSLESFRGPALGQPRGTTQVGTS